MLRGLYLKYGRRGGPHSRDKLPLVCVVHEATSEKPETWVSDLFQNGHAMKGALVGFAFSDGSADLDLLPKCKVFVVAANVATGFLEALLANGMFDQDVFVVVNHGQTRRGLWDDPRLRVRIVSPPVSEDVINWLDQFS